MQNVSEVFFILVHALQLHKKQLIQFIQLLDNKDIKRPKQLLPYSVYNWSLAFCTTCFSAHNKLQETKEAAKLKRVPPAFLYINYKNKIENECAIPLLIFLGEEQFGNLQDILSHC